MLDIKKGQTVYVNEFGRRRNNEEVIEAKVATLGRKFFTLEGFHKRKFYIETGMNVTDFTATTKVYDKLEDFEDHNLHSKLNVLVMERLRRNLDLSDLIKVAAALNIEY